MAKGKNVEVKLNVTPRKCLCGCDEWTKGGEFRIGHDARYKSQLINIVLEDKPGAKAALSTLEARNWEKFLVKARESRAKKATRTPRAPKAASKVSDGRLSGVDLIEAMKKAAAIVKGTGIQVTRQNYQAIIDGTFEPENAPLEPGDTVKTTYRSATVEAQITEISGTRAKIAGHSKSGKPFNRVVELASLTRA